MATPELIAPYTPMVELSKIHADLTTSFLSHLPHPLAFRQHQLLQVARMVQTHADEFSAALWKDLGKPKQETYLSEIGGIVERCVLCARSLEGWMKDEEVDLGRTQGWMVDAGWKSRIRREAKGVALIIAPWNYPLVLSLQPLYGAISAGCCAVIKLSEVSPHYAATLSKYWGQYLDERCYRLVKGGVPEVTRLLEFKWDHIFYTGHGAVGRIVAAAAAKHLTPCTLELGGKSPVILDPQYTIDGEIDEAWVERTARRVMWGKIQNAGQLCMSPDYILTPPSLIPSLLAALPKILLEFFPPPSTALTSPSYGRIVSTAHFNRIKGLLETTKGRIVVGGLGEGCVDEDAGVREVGESAGRGGKIAPAVVLVEEGDVLLDAELFAPILPILAVENVDKAIEYIRKRDHPLVLYAFTEDEAVKEKILRGTMSGNVCFNDNFMQIAVNELPFGGVGESGYGRQTVKYSFDDFTYARSITEIPKKAEVPLRYPPYTDESLAFFAASVNMTIPDTIEPTTSTAASPVGQEPTTTSAPATTTAAPKEVEAVENHNADKPKHHSHIGGVVSEIIHSVEHIIHPGSKAEKGKEPETAVADKDTKLVKDHEGLGAGPMDFQAPGMTSGNLHV